MTSTEAFVCTRFLLLLCILLSMKNGARPVRLAMVDCLLARLIYGYLVIYTDAWCGHRWGYVGIMENKMETITMGVYIGVIQAYIIGVILG